MWPALIAAGAQLVGGLIGRSGQQQTNAQNLQIAQQTNQFNAQQAQLNRDFQERMSDTQWQRGVADMRAAGLNPALAYQQGGAGTPGGSAASGVSTRFDNPNAPLGNSVANAVSTAMDVYEAKQRANLDIAQQYKAVVEGGRTQLDTELMSDAEVAKARKDTILAQLDSLQTNADQNRANTSLAKSREQLTDSQTARTDVDINLDKQLLENPRYRDYVAPWMNSAKDVERTLGPAVSTLAKVVHTF